MDLRNLPEHLSSTDRCNERRQRIEQELHIDLSALTIDPTKLGHAEERNCEQMFGHVPIPVGYAGPLPVIFSSRETADIHLPLATTEGALVASVNRGCKAIAQSGGAILTSTYHGITRSIALKIPSIKFQASKKSQISNLKSQIQMLEHEWKIAGEVTSNHLKILKYDIDTQDDCVFLTIYADTDEAMGMNMVTIAAEAIGKWLAENMDVKLVTVAANVDSDKKPSQRTHDHGRGYEVTATATVPLDVIRDVLKTTPEALLEVAHAKLDLGSDTAGAIGHNCHAANIIAALYLATGQDPAHVVEGSLADTIISLSRSSTPRLRLEERERVRVRESDTITISTRVPALIVGIRGGGTTLPAQQQCLNLLLKAISYKLKAPQQLAEVIGAAVLAGELSLLAALASHTMAHAHSTLARLTPAQSPPIRH